MHSRRAVFALVGCVFAVAACATGAVSETGGGQSGGNVDSGVAIDAGYGWGDEGGLADTDGGLVHPPHDGGGITLIDSGTGTPDSGSTSSPGDFCVGDTSSYDGNTYDAWCDYDYFELDNRKHNTFQCASNADCQGFGVTGCCFQPSPTSDNGYCYDDYGNVPQCVPQ